MRKTAKRNPTLTLSAEKVRQLQSVKPLELDQLVHVVGGFCDCSSFKCPP